jgi:hypothetical protein
MTSSSHCPRLRQYLKSDVRFESLDEIAYAISDNEAAKRLQATRRQLFGTIFGRKKAG